MPWYIDVFILLTASVAGGMFFSRKFEKVKLQKMTTGDGYQVNLMQLLEMERKSITRSSEVNQLVSPIRYDKGDMIIMASFASFLMYVAVGNLVSVFFPIDNEWFGIGTLAFVFFLTHLDGIKAMKKANVFVQELRMEAPSEYKQYGGYAQNPIDMKKSLDELAELEDSWLNWKTKRDHAYRKVEDMEKNAQNYSMDWLKHEKEDLEGVERRLRKIGSEIALKVGLLTENLVTDFPIGIVRDILKSKPAPESETIQSAPPKIIPHYIEVMKEITLNPGLPEDVKQEAQALIDSYKKDEMNREQEAEIANALLEIQTVKKFLVKAG